MAFYIILLVSSTFIAGFLIVLFFNKLKLPGIHYLYSLLLLITMIGILRNNNPETPSWIVFYQLVIFIAHVTACYLLFSFLLNTRSGLKNAILVIICLGMGFICLNYVLYFLGFRASFEIDIGKALILSYFGFDVQRILFPLGGGYVSFGEFSGGIMVMGIVFFMIEKSLIKRTFSAIVVLLSMFALLLVDSRASLMFVIFTIFILWISLRFKIIHWIPNLVWLIPLFPLFFVLFSQYLADSEMLAPFLRSKTDLITGNGRLIIWGVSVMEFIQPKLIHLVGYGNFGQVASGASYEWADVVATFNSPELTSAHNTFIQLLFDFGYLGVLVFLLTLYTVLKTAVEFYLAGFRHALMLIVFLCHYILIGVFGSVYFFGHRAFFVFLAVIVLIFILRSRGRFLIKN